MVPKQAVEMIGPVTQVTIGRDDVVRVRGERGELAIYVFTENCRLYFNITVSTGDKKFKVFLGELVELLG